MAWECAALGVNTRESCMEDGAAGEKPKVEVAGVEGAVGDAAGGGAARAAPPAMIEGSIFTIRLIWWILAWALSL